MMTEKIEWYKEVLELEPNSKVFLPLARIYAARNEVDEAVAALEHGLSRHPEHMEARLFLIELLYKSGRQADCTAHVREMSRLFSSYAHFWQAWAVCLRTAGEAPEMSAALRLMAVNFLYGPISISTIMEKGLDAVLGELTPAAARVADKVLAPVADEDAASETPLSGVSCMASVANAAADDVACVPHEASVPSAMTEVAAAAAEINDDDVLPADMPLPRDADLDMPVGFAVEGEGPALHAPAAEAEEVVSADALTPRTPPVVVAPAAKADGHADEEEGFSLRTRSMAEVLAEQGDVQGALDIYHELAAAAATPGESADLRQRIATLTARLTGQPVLEPVAEQPAEAAPGKEKLINVLEALAERVEARAQN